jgi:uncharacterized protein YndB with AHSA1/START domain
MTFQQDATVIRWRLHLVAAPAAVFHLLTTDEGRRRFWAEAAVERDNHIDFVFSNGLTWRGEILACEPACRFSLRYFDNSITTFTLAADGAGGTDLTLTDRNVPTAHRCEVIAGWVSVLMALKAAVDFGVDLRNHDPARTWDQGFVDN